MGRGLLCGGEEQAGVSGRDCGVPGAVLLVDFNRRCHQRGSSDSGGLDSANPERRLSVGLGAQPVRGFSVKP